jgi:hypothetical protein
VRHTEQDNENLGTFLQQIVFTLVSTSRKGGGQEYTKRFSFQLNEKVRRDGGKGVGETLLVSELYLVKKVEFFTSRKGARFSKK